MAPAEIGRQWPARSPAVPAQGRPSPRRGEKSIRSARCHSPANAPTALRSIRHHPAWAKRGIGRACRPGPWPGETRGSGPSTPADRRGPRTRRHTAGRRRPVTPARWGPSAGRDAGWKTVHTRRCTSRDPRRRCRPVRPGARASTERRNRLQPGGGFCLIPGGQVHVFGQRVSARSSLSAEKWTRPRPVNGYRATEGSGADRGTAPAQGTIPRPSRTPHPIRPRDGGSAGRPG